MKVKVLKDVSITCDPPAFTTFSWQTMEQQAKALLQWTAEFHSFIRDHRSMDGMQLNIQKHYEDQCGHCHYEWEVDAETGEPLCCAKAQEEWAATQPAPSH